MKKLIVLAAISCLFIGTYMTAKIQLPSYHIKIKNETDGQIKVRIDYGGPGVCNPDQFIVNKGKIREIKPGLCCAFPIEITATSGMSKGKTHEYRPPVTGMGLSCRGFNFVVKNTEDGDLIAETY